MIEEGTLLWEPSQTWKENANITAFMNWLNVKKGLDFHDYQALWQWSVDEVEDFWQSIWDYFEIKSSQPYRCVLENSDMPGSVWFPGARVNYAKYMLKNWDSDKTAVYYLSENSPVGQLTFRELSSRVLILANELRRLGVQPGERVVAYMPTIPEALIAMLATMSIGAVWSSCSPDFGTKSVLDRFQQLEPKVLFAVDGYRYGGGSFDRREEVQAIRQGLPSLQHTIYLPYLLPTGKPQLADGEYLWGDLLNKPEIPFAQFEFEDVPFEHPLWVLFSSGTTGIPKGIVHSHGGVLLEIYKTTTFHANLGPESCMFFYTTTGWMMFNMLAGALLTGASIVLYDGNPGYPHIGILWEIAEKTGVTFFGASPTYVNLMVKAGLSPKQKYDLSKLESVLLSGSPSTPETFRWVYENVKKDLWLTSQSGGTDIASGFVGAIPIEPVHAGEIQVRMLGVHVQSYNDDGQPIVDEIGELVVTKPMPSMPIYFWNDKENRRYMESYFDVFPGVWRHGDFLKITSRGTCVIYGRSDSTLNRYGVRIGTSEIYRAVEALEEVQDSLIVNLDLPQGRFFMPLFVVLKQGFSLDEAMIGKINDKIRSDCSPRHVPDKIYPIPSVPYTLTGKKMEVPVRKILMGIPESKAANRGAMANPSSLDYFVNFLQQNNDYSLLDENK